MIFRFERFIGVDIEAVFQSLCRSAHMGTAFAHAVDHHAVGAGKRIDKRLDRYRTETDLRIGNDNTRLHSVTDTRHFKAVIDDLQIQLVFGDLAAHDLHAVLSGEQRQHRRCDLQIVDTSVSIGK